MGGCRVVEAAGRGLAGLAGRLVTVERPQGIADGAAGHAERIEADRAGLPTHGDGWKDPVRLAPFPTGPERRRRDDAMKALPDGQWATAEGHTSTGGAATGSRGAVLDCRERAAD